MINHGSTVFALHVKESSRNNGVIDPNNSLYKQESRNTKFDSSKNKMKILENEKLGLSDDEI